MTKIISTVIKRSVVVISVLPETVETQLGSFFILSNRLAFWAVKVE